MTYRRRVIIGARTSPLSVAQTEEVLRQLRPLYPDVEFTVTPVNTGGDRNKEAPLLSMERGMFVKEIELALLAGEIDVAVHSAKDMPAEIPDGLCLAAFTERQDPRDVLVNRWRVALVDLPSEARLGTSSPRRTAQLTAARPDLRFLPIRGNVGTRLEKSVGDDYDGVVLAAAGMLRLGVEDQISEYLSADICTPDVGQGALAVQVRSADSDVVEMMKGVDHSATSTAVRLERAFLAAVGGGCKAPVAAYAYYRGDRLQVSAMAAAVDGSEILRHNAIYSPDDPESAGREVAEALLARGAGRLMAAGAG